jgi:toxin ParE1/3/4
MAEEDLIQIFISGAELFGVEQAQKYHQKLFEIFSLLADNPQAAHLRPEIKPPIRAHPVGSHIVIYDLRDDGDIFILRIRHAREDWLGNMN